MIKRLRRQLTALFTITTGLILTLVVIGILVISAREFNKKNLDSFQNQILNITSRLQSGSTVSCTWLSRLESDNRLIIHIEERQASSLPRFLDSGHQAGHLNHAGQGSCHGRAH